MASVIGESEAETTRIIRRRDTEQMRLLKTHYRVDSNDPELYDLVFNTDGIAIDTIADLLIMLIRKRIAVVEAPA